MSKAAFELTVNPDNPDPLPTKNPAVIVAGVVTLPVTHICPPVFKLPPVTLPVANTAPPVVNALPATVPPALTAPLVFKFPPEALPVTVNDPSVPTVVKLDVVTLALNVVPVISAAGALETTPVN